ncbi:MAG: MBL fold metallo-hydrolase [Betaproteobacteria bacterium]|nr:MAG: MBL fold metallo-hydrolase [Betaproteobacteria bacterium]TAN50840.1 MAG: MBL fold metallo-hydrolase [Betaproteobacteria bacterium]
MADASPLEFPFASLPAPGAAIAVAPGMHWLRMPLPFDLDHINLWLLEEEGGWTLIDSGLGNKATRALWEQVIAQVLGGRPLKRIVVTHYHPDHAGNAAWLSRRFGARLWMTRAEFLTAHAVLHGAASFSAEASAALFRANGLDEQGTAMLLQRGDLYRKLVPEFPLEHRRLMHGSSVRLGGRDWQVLVGYGHAPEHASLYCRELNVVVSGDMLLPKISTNVAVRPIDPSGDPLRLFLESIRQYGQLDAQVLVLPSHGVPFRGAQARVAALEAHHAARLDELQAACRAAPRSAAEVLEVLFRRRLDSNQIFFAMGESIAHLHYLHYAGRLRRATGSDGVIRYAGA